jgi:hypothetical protein
MADLMMRRRPALHAGEIGLFIDSPVFEAEWDTIKQGTDITVTATQSRNPKQFRLFWGLAAKLAESGVFGDADTRDVVKWLLMKCKHVEYVTTKFRHHEETIPVVKSIRFASMEQTAFNRLFERALYIITTEILPDMPAGELRAEVEKMSGVETPEPTPPKRRGRPPRTKPSMPDPVSIIPDTDPVTAGSVPNFPGQPSPSCRHDGEGQPTDPDPAPEPVTEPMAIDPAPSADPAPSPVANAERGPITRDLEGWRTYCLAWLEQYRIDPEKTEQDILIRWQADRKVRNACGVTSVDSQPVYEVYLNLVDEKRRKVKST